MIHGKYGVLGGYREEEAGAGLPATAVISRSKSTSTRRTASLSTCGKGIWRSIGERHLLVVRPSEDHLRFIKSIEEKKLDPEDRLG